MLNPNMTDLEIAEKHLDAVLRRLGFNPKIEREMDDDGEHTLQLSMTDSDHLIGEHGERLDDLQYLVNRLIQRENPEANRVKVDCDHYRVQQEDELISEVLDLADRVKATGKALKLRPLNSYYRRIAHQAVIDDPEVETVSPRSKDRLKRIIIRPAR